ncbi:MAG TPA: ribbon-helix-helix domain-containing protein [Desulfobacterales bacterium]|nr:ribbon-helix-helix domain-containing protein [Desulfobacterales bacterium]
MKRIDTYITLQQIAKLKALAEETGLKVAELIRRALDEYLWKVK